MSKHRIVLSSLSESEVELTRRMARPDAMSWSFLVLFLGIGAFLAFSFALGLVGRLLGAQAEVYGRYLGGLVALVLFGYSAISYGSHEARERRRAKADLERNEAEEIQVEDARVVALDADHSSVDPSICFDIGDGKLLLMKGQWIWDAGMYGAVELDTDVDDEPPWINGLPPPHSFPSTAFTVRRLPETGTVLSIRVHGPYLSPERALSDLSLKRYALRQMSELLTGSLDDVEAALLQQSDELARS